MTSAQERTGRSGVRRKFPLLLAGAIGVLVMASGCTDKPIPGLKKVDCAADDIAITLSGGSETPRAGNQHVDSITVNVTCKKPAPGGPIKGADVQVKWPGGSTSTGVTDANGNVTITSQAFPTSSGPGTASAGVNGSDDKSQNEKGSIP